MGLMHNEFAGETFTCEPAPPGAPAEASRCFETGDEVLRFYEMEDVDVWGNFAVLWGLSAAFRILGYVALRFLNKPTTNLDTTNAPMPREWVEEHQKGWENDFFRRNKSRPSGIIVPPKLSQADTEMVNFAAGERAPTNNVSSAV